jgi:hypothetical protein
MQMPFRRGGSMLGSNYLVQAEHARPIGPGTHAALDYLTVGAFLMLAWKVRHHSRACGLALANAGAVLATSLMTDYPGGAAPTITFEQHGQLDVAQAAMSGLGPLLLGFADEPEARLFYGQSLLETAIVSATDFNGASDDGRAATTSRRVDRGETIFRNTPLPSEGEL